MRKFYRDQRKAHHSDDSAARKAVYSALERNENEVVARFMETKFRYEQQLIELRRQSGGDRSPAGSAARGNSNVQPPPDYVKAVKMFLGWPIPDERILSELQGLACRVQGYGDVEWAEAARLLVKHGWIVVRAMAAKEKGDVDSGRSERTVRTAELPEACDIEGEPAETGTAEEAED